MLMEETGALSVTFLDAQDTPVFEPLPGETRLWGDTDILALYDAEIDTGVVLAQIKASNMFPADFAHKVEQIEDKDWEREWMDNFHPMKFGERLWICPSWRDIPEPDAVNVMLDPGLAFGTGTHPTTALCLDIPCGSASPNSVDRRCIAQPAEKSNPWPCSHLLNLHQQSHNHIFLTSICFQTQIRPAVYDSD